jgi:release factor glutamine methyltransferase
MSDATDLLAATATRLMAVGIQDARLEAEWLLQHVTGIPRLHRAVRDHGPIDSVARMRFESLVTRRCLRVPLQHLVGTAPFLDFELRVTPDVLVPRPETESLALRALQFLPDAPRRAIDLGTGSGCLALALARRRPNLDTHAMDLSLSALEVARENARRLGLENRIRFHHADAFGDCTPLEEWGRFDVVVTNPPYIPSAEIAVLQPEVRDHDPRLALDGGVDGLDPYRNLARHAPSMLIPDGILLAEFGDGQAGDLTRLFARHGWNEIAVEKDLSGRDRILIVRAPRSNQSPTPRCGPTGANSPWTVS